MKDNSKWMSLDDAIARVMAVDGCSRRVARRKLAKAAKDNKLRFERKKVVEPPLKKLGPEEAVRLFEEDPSQLWMPLVEFKVRADFTSEEILGELKSGRLRAGTSETALFDLEATGKLDPQQCFVDYQAIINWVKHPETPETLLDKFNRSFGPRH